MSHTPSDVAEPVAPEWRTRHVAVRDFFAEHRQSWRDRYGSDILDARNYRRRGDVALALLHAVPQGGNRLLDVGCGAGVQAAAAQRSGWTVFATDLALAFLHQAQEEFPSPHWIAAAAEDLPFPAGSFDVIMILGVIGYVSEPPAVLRALRDLLVPEGYLIISWARDRTLLESVSHVVSALPDRFYTAAKRMLERGGAAASIPTNTGFYVSYNRFWSPRAFRECLADTGFMVRHMHSVNFGQFRFMDHALWPERGDALLSAALERVACLPGCSWLGQFARTHVALVQRRG